MDVLSKKKGLLTVRYGEVWNEQRRFSLMLLRNFGVGKKAMEEKILEEATYLIEAFTEKMSVPFDPYELVDIAVTNIIFIIIFGKRFEYDNTFLKTLLDMIHQSSKITAGPWALLYNAVPLVRRLPLPHQRILTTSKKTQSFIKKEVEEHKATLVPGEPRDFTDAYLEEMQKAERKGSSFEEEQLRMLVSQLFMAGTETTARTIQWGFLYLMAFPEIQEKCQKEIDTVLGNSASLKYEDRENLPYTNAVIHEIQRVSNVAALGIPHAPIKDVQLFGYKIPKLYNTVPLVRRLPLPHQRILTTAKKVEAFIEKEMEEHKATLVPGEPRDFTDAYLEEMQKAERKGSSFEEEQLQILLFDLFLAGTETMAGTLLWGLLYLMAFPEIQEKCWKEIDAVLGNNASLKYEDRENLPYTNAVIHEIQRISNVAALGLPHAPLQDVQLFGYKIPKDTMVFVNLQSAHFDESQWKFPDEFNPSNFLNEKGEFVKPEAFLAFSAGPRVCLGENLARMEIFLFFTSILRNFQLLWPDKSQAPDFTSHYVVTQSPSRFKMSLKCRQPSE
ncbi:cytochrome P450 2J6-like isoform 2-T2 [Liasis olivaceus]